MSLAFVKNQSDLFLVTTKPTNYQKRPMTVASYVLVKHLVDQFNHYRYIDILSRINKCDPNMNFNDICEVYSVDNRTFALRRRSNIVFRSFQHIFDALINQKIVRKLNQLCSSVKWCLGNLIKDDMRFTANVLRQTGHSFCSLEKCHSRLKAYTTTCPSISIKVTILKRFN